MLDEGHGTAKLGNAFEIASDPQHMKIMTMIQEWVKWCDREHDGCSKPSLICPRRLVDIGIRLDSQMRLVQDIAAVKYVALSHCWGKHRSFITERETLLERLESISFERLPKTCRDAIAITRTLGVRYIWIDSLCILQNDR